MDEQNIEKDLALTVAKHRLIAFEMPRQSVLMACLTSQHTKTSTQRFTT
jgi:hypothetical protein